MSQKLESLAMVDIAEHLLKEEKGPMTIASIFQRVSEIKAFEMTDIDLLTQLYMDMTQSAKFVYCGDDMWDLKAFNLELWDEDGSRFIKAEEIVEDELEEDLDVDAYVVEEELSSIIDDEIEDLEEIDEEILEAKEYIDVELPITSLDDDIDNDLDIEFDDDDYDETDYNDIMDDYEDMYDE